jgi:hypothetical protein
VPGVAGGSSAFEDEMTYAGERPLGG